MLCNRYNARTKYCQPPMVSTFGYALSTAAIKKMDDETDIPLLTKARALGPVVLRDYVATPSDPKAQERFFTGFEKLVSRAADKLNRIKEMKYKPAPAGGLKP